MVGYSRADWMVRAIGVIGDVVNDYAVLSVVTETEKKKISSLKRSSPLKILFHVFPHFA